MLFTGKYVWKDDYGNKYYTNSKDERWVIYSDIEATKITTDWFLWMHKTIDKVPDKDNQKKYKWQIDHSSNKTGTIDSYKPIKIGKKKLKKNMIHGNKNLIFLIVLILFFPLKFTVRKKISSSPLINIDKIKPSFDEVEEKNENLSVNRKLKKK